MIKAALKEARCGVDTFHEIVYSDTVALAHRVGIDEFVLELRAPSAIGRNKSENNSNASCHSGHPMYLAHFLKTLPFSSEQIWLIQFSNASCLFRRAAKNSDRLCQQFASWCSSLEFYNI